MKPIVFWILAIIFCLTIIHLIFGIVNVLLFIITLSIILGIIAIPYDQINYDTNLKHKQYYKQTKN
jgi:hypothetical protein